MSTEKHFSILAISELDSDSIKDAMQIFRSYKENGIILSGCFSDDQWPLSNQIAMFTFDFSLKPKESKPFADFFGLSITQIKKALKAYTAFLLGELALHTIQDIIFYIKTAIYYPKDQLIKIFDEKSKDYSDRLSDFISILPCTSKEKEEYLEIIDQIKDKNIGRGNQRTLASFDSYYRFDRLLDQFWDEAIENEKLFYFPIWLWWKLTSILPQRPQEFILIPRNCLSYNNNQAYLTVMRNKIKGSKRAKGYKISEDFRTEKYPIPFEMASEIKWYIEKTNSCAETELHTLFVTETHYNQWERKPYITSRYYTYTNLSTCLRYFYLYVIQERYGYHIIFDKVSKLTDPKEIEYLHLGDTRHLALISMILTGATPTVAMTLAGHNSIEMTSHYYSNISSLVECLTYRQYNRALSGVKNYSLSKPTPPRQSEKYILLQDGSRCYSPRALEGSFEDCYKVTGPGSELGLCGTCTYHRDKDKGFHASSDIYIQRIENECIALEKIVNKVRKHKGYPEEITTVLLRLRDQCNDYQKYLSETVKENSNE